MPNIRSVVAAATTAVAFGAGAAVVLVGNVGLTLAAPSVSTVVEPVAVSRNLVCAGDVLGAAGDGSGWYVMANTTVKISGGSASGELTNDTTTNGTVVSYDTTPDAVAATESSSAKTDAVAGYLAAECGDPTNSQWLVGGSTMTGRDGVVTISNAGSVDATVDLEFWGADGPISAPAASGLVIPGHSQKSYSLAGFVPNEASPVVHVTSNGAAVWSTLQVSTIRGLTPSGLDRITGVSGPSTSVVVPVVREPSEAEIGALRSGVDTGDLGTSLRLLAPGDTDTVASISIVMHDGSAPVELQAELKAGSVFEVPLEELATGDFSVFVTSPEPVLASVRFSSHSTSSSVTDFAWATGVPATIGPATGYSPASDSTLAISNPGDSAISVTIVASGQEATVNIPAMSTQAVIVGRGVVRVEGDEPFAASLLAETARGVAVVKLPTEPLGARSVTVIAH
jgi:hypothetical protein